MRKRKEAYVGEQVKNLVNLLTTEVKISGRNIKDYEKPLKLKRMVDIYGSSLCDYSKIYEMSLLYTYRQYSSAIKPLLRFEDDLILGDFVKKLIEIDSFYSKCDKLGVTKEVNSLVKMEHYFYSYNYAKFLITEYIRYSESPSIIKFLENYGVDTSFFEYCVQVVNELDPDLYSVYQAKNEYNQKLRINQNLSDMNEIVRGIKTGKTLDGKEFDAVEFLKLIPFFDMDSSKEVLNDFNIRKGADFSTRIRTLFNYFYPNDYREILTFLNENKIDNVSFQQLREKDVYGTKIIVNGREITEEDKHVIMGYIRENGLPMVGKSYDAVRKKYLNGGITKEDVKSKKYVPFNKPIMAP